MKTFVDATGRTWVVAVNVAAIKLVRGLIGVDLYRLFTDGGKPFGDLLSDPVQLVDALYCLCREECRQRGMSDEDFGRLMAGETLSLATDALVGSLIDFFPNPTTRKAVTEIVEKSQTLQGILSKKALDQIQRIDPEKVADEILRSSGLSGNSPESSASTPAPLLFAN
jgi:hypothetical protein